MTLNLMIMAIIVVVILTIIMTLIMIVTFGEERVTESIYIHKRQL